MNTLFSTTKFYDEASALTKSLENRIKNLERSDFKNSTMDQLTAVIKEEYELEIPELKEDDIYTKKPEDIKIRIQNRNPYGGRSSQIDGTRFTFVIPFNGKSSDFNIMPSKFSSVFPLANISGNEISIIFEIPAGRDASGLRGEFDRSLDIIKKYLGFLQSDFDRFNNQLEPLIKSLLERRKAKLDKDDETASGFGFPVK